MFRSIQEIGGHVSRGLGEISITTIMEAGLVAVDGIKKVSGIISRKGPGSSGLLRMHRNLLLVSFITCHQFGTHVLKLACLKAALHSTGHRLMTQGGFLPALRRKHQPADTSSNKTRPWAPALVHVTGPFSCPLGGGGLSWLQVGAHIPAASGLP